MRLIQLVALLVLALSTAVPSFSASRVALVIGNGKYTAINPLRNPVNDATDMAAMLEKLGFTVFGGNDLTYVDMGTKIGEFADAAAEAEVTLFFYAGHGVQVNGRNYLVPVNAKMEREATLQFEAIDSEMVLSVMSGPNKTAIALLDACRDNPLPRSIARSRSTAIANGLAAPAMAGGGMLIGFATSPQETAADSTTGSRNSPFTQALLKHINTPGLEIQSLMTRVKSDVYASTKKEQQPWHNSSLREEFFLVPQGKSDLEPPQPAPQESDLRVEWSILKESRSIAALDAFIAKHADQPVFVALAEDRKALVIAQDKTSMLEVLQAKQKEDDAQKTSDVLESLKIPKTVAPQQGAKDLIKQLALNLNNEGRQPIAKQRSAVAWTPQKFFEYARDANAGNTIFALLGTAEVKLSSPPANPGKRNNTFALTKIAEAPALEALLANNPQLSFSPQATTTCLLHWVDRCPYLSASFFDGLSAAMSAAGMDIMNGGNGYYAISRIAGSTDYLVSNNPRAGQGDVAIVAAVISEDFEVKQVYGFDVSPAKFGAAAGSPDADILLTWAALEGDDLYVSFDATHRCTDGPRKFGFMAKFSVSDRTVKWVSPFSVSDANFIVNADHILSSNGGSCTDDFVYKLNKDTGAIIARFKTPSAVQYMDGSSGSLVLQLYEGAAAYQLN
jgi:uncharacterized caspase-like protein